MGSYGFQSMLILGVYNGDGDQKSETRTIGIHSEQ